MKTALKIIAVVIVLLVVIAIAAPFLVNVNRFRPEIESNLSSALGRQVGVGNLSLSILSGSVGADQLTIADDPKFSNSPFITAKSLKVGVELIPLIFSKQLNVTNIDIDQPVVNLLRNQSGTWNFSSLGNQSAQAAPPGNQNAQTAQPAKKPVGSGNSSPARLTIDKLQLTNGKITVGWIPARRKPVTYENVDLTMKNFSFTQAFPVTLSMSLPGGGSVKLDGTMGPINSADTSLTPLQAKLSINKLDLAQSAIVEPSLGIAGMADFDGTLNSDGKIAKTDGTIKATNLKLVPKGAPAGRPVQFQYSIQHDLQKEAGQILQGDVSMGKANAKLTGAYDMSGPMTAVRIKLTGQGMPVDELEAMLPAVGVVLPSGSQLKGGTLNVDLNADGPLDRLVTTGSVRLSNSRLAGFNLGSKMSAISALTGKAPSSNDTSIQNASTDVRMDPSGTQLSKINVAVPALGTVVGAGTISPSGALSFKMSADVSGGAASGLTQMAGLGKGGAIPFMIQGTTSNPTFMPDVQGMVGNKLKGLMQPGNQKNPLGGLGGLFGKKKPN